jgi:hypothetical protein
VKGFRLTEFGQQVLGDNASPLAPTQETASTDAWVVQPNFDVMVYIEKASPGQLVFIEWLAERQQQSPRHVARYVLTRDSVYRALEGGCGVDAALSGLGEGSKNDVPANVVAEIRGWAGLREQMVVRRGARLVAFQTEAEREAYLDPGLKGQPVGDRILLLDGGLSRKVQKQIAARLDYTQRLPPCLLVDEAGVVRLATQHPDLLIHSQLDQWAEPAKNGCRQLTAKSVRAAVQQGRSVDELVALLDSRTKRRIPDLLRVALHAWAGQSFPAELERVVVMRCPRPDLFQAIAGSISAGSCLRGRLGPDTFLVDATKLKQLKDTMRWAGIQVAQEVTPPNGQGPKR